MIKHTVFDNVLSTLNDAFMDYDYEVDLTTTPDGDYFPRIVVEELENSSLQKDNMGIVSLSVIGIRIEIYAKARRKGTSMISGRSIACELSDVCAYVCEEIYKLKRTTCKPTPNIDDSIYKITMIYNTKQSDTGRSLFM